MIVLHSLWSSQSKLCIWGEDSSLADALLLKGRKRTRHAGQPGTHPFASGVRSLREAVGEVGGELLIDDLAQTDVTLLLPSRRDAPQASPHLLFAEEENARDAVIRVAPWSMPSLALSPRDALDMMLSLAEATSSAVRIGASLNFFAEVAKLALEFVARGRVLPRLLKRGQKFQALWRPVADGMDDKERLRLLARAMPALCRAEYIEASTEGRAPGAILRDMIDCVVDAFIRRTLNERPLIKASGKGRRATSSVPVESWLTALTAHDPSVAGSPAELSNLQKHLDEWTRLAFDVTRNALRTCFRLTPPSEDENGGAGTSRKAQEARGWRLEFLLQATDDQSLLVPADTVWKTRGDVLTFSDRKLENPQERLLEDLGRATRVYPALESALRKARPVAFELDAEGAYGFLRAAAPLLEQSGFGVLLPSWWKRPAARLGVKLKVRPKDESRKNTSSGLLGLEGICDYEWEVALGDEQLSFEDFIKLAGLKVPLVKVRGQWVELKRDEIEAALAFFAKHGAVGEMTVGEALRMGLGVDASEVGLPVVAVEGRGWLGQLFGADGEQRLSAVKTPSGFVGSLRPYQERGLSWLLFLGSLGLGACLADDMGLGKTVQLLAQLLAERQGTGDAQAARRGPTLLICPMSVVGNWQRESERFAPVLRVHVHHGAERLSGKRFAKAVAKSDLVITTYALAARDRELLAGMDWHRAALDEAQNIKNPAAKQTQAIRSLKAAERVALTGTPVENRLSELWSIMEFLNPGLLGSASGFRTRFANPIERYRDEEKARLLKRLTGPFILRRLKTDKSIIRDLPDKLEMKTFCNLTREQASLYQAVVDEMLEKIEGSEGIERKGLVLSTLMKLKQVCNHPAHLLQDGSTLAHRSGKLARLEELLEEILAADERVLCFTQFAEFGHRLREHVQERTGREVLFLHGGTTKKARDQMVARFQSADGPHVFLLSLKAGGTGLNLTAANHVIHFDRWWNPAVEDQATDRAFRIGQKKNVQVRKFICIGTLEERIDQMIEQKKELATRIVGTGEAWLTELSTAQIREMVALSTEAVSE
jgi:hypothetical protein